MDTKLLSIRTEVAIGGGETQILGTGMNGHNEFNPGSLPFWLHCHSAGP